MLQLEDDKSQARELNPKIIEHFKSLLAGNRYDSVMINLGKDYLPAILGLESILPKETHLTFAQGRIGPRQKQMIEWILSVSKWTKLNECPIETINSII